MTPYIVALAVLVIGMLVMVLAFGFATIRHYEAEADWQQERRELINRIQRPEYTVPTMADPERFTLSTDVEPDQVDLINTIADSPDPPAAAESGAE